MNNKIPSPSPRNILIIHTHGGMGDLIVSSVLAEALKRSFPACRVTVWPQRRYIGLFDHHPFVDACLELDPAAPVWTNLRPLRAHGFDAVIISWSVTRHAWLAWLAAIPIRVGRTDRLLYSFLYTHRVHLRSRQGDRTSQWTDIQLDYARSIGCQASPDLKPIVVVTPTEKEKAAAFLKSNGITGEKRICGLHVCKGLVVDEARWPLDRFVEIAAGLLRQGFDVAVTGVANEKPLTAAVAERARTALAADPGTDAPGRITDLAGLCSLRETAAVIARMDALICPDTGVGHLAAALNVPTVAIFPVRSDISARWRPAIDAYRVIRPTRYDYCTRKCVNETCPRFECLLHVDAAEVVAAVLAIAR